MINQAPSSGPTVIKLLRLKFSREFSTKISESENGELRLFLALRKFSEFVQSEINPTSPMLKL
jgi:hypothetical protein